MKHLPQFHHGDSIPSLGSIASVELGYIGRFHQVFAQDEFQSTSPMAMDNAEVRRSVQSRPIQCRHNMIKRLISCLPSHVYDCLFLQPQSVIRWDLARS